MHGVARSALGLIGLVGGAATVILGLVSFLGEGTWYDFLFRVGIAYLVIAAVAFVFLLAQGVRFPATEAEEKTVTGALWVAVGGTALWAFVGFLVAAIAPGVTLHGMLELLGAAGLFLFATSIIESWEAIVALIRESSKPSRPCPRCGHFVRAGVMKCPSCQFDFWSVGREES